MSEQEIQEIRISELPEAAPLQGDELLEMVQGGENVKVRADQLGGGVEEAPEDGKQYARKDGAWAEVVASGGGGGDESTVTLNFEGVDPADDGQWVPLYTDFPDTTKTYKGTVEIVDSYGQQITYTARVVPAFAAYGMWIVEMAHGEGVMNSLTYITSSYYQAILMGYLEFNVYTGLPNSIYKLSGEGIVDRRSLLGIPATNPTPFEIELGVNTGYADVLVETPVYTVGDVPFDMYWAFQGIKDKLVDTLEAFPTDLYTLLAGSEIFKYGFTKGAKYWEVNSEIEDDDVKLTVKTASDDSQIFRFPIL